MKGLGIFRRRGRRGGSTRLPGDIRAGFARLVITTYTALIEKSNNISSAVSSLVLTTYQASIGRDINVTTGTPVALTVTPLQATITNPAAAATISEDSWTESTGIWRVFTDQPSNGNWHWARFADGTTGITADGSGGWSSTPQESGTLAVAASGDPIDIPETGTTGTAYELFIYQRNTSGADSNVLTTGYVADNTLPTLGSLATNVAGDTITGTVSETIETPSGQPAVGDFTLGGVAAGSVIDSITFSGTSFTASIASNPAVNGESVTLAYTKGANVVRDLRRNEMASFSAQAVTNNVPSAGLSIVTTGVVGGTRTNTTTYDETVDLSGCVAGDKVLVAVFSLNSFCEASSVDIDGDSSSTNLVTTSGQTQLRLYEVTLTGPGSATATITVTYVSAYVDLALAWCAYRNGSRTGQQMEWVRGVASDLDVTATNTDNAVWSVVCGDFNCAGFTPTNATEYGEIRFPAGSGNYLAGATAEDFGTSTYTVTQTMGDLVVDSSHDATHVLVLLEAA